MNLRPFNTPRPGQRIVCSRCGRLENANLIRVDLDAPAMTFYCLPCLGIPFAVGDRVRRVEIDAKGFETITEGIVEELYLDVWPYLAFYRVLRRRCEHPIARDLGRDLPAPRELLACELQELTKLRD